MPFQFNFNSGGGLVDETAFNLNFQPVIPIHLSPALNMIARTIVPIDSFPASPGIRFSGVGDIQEQLFFSPAKPGKVIVGVGPVFSFPTATAEPAKTGTWAAGGSVLLVVTPGPWVVGVLATQLSPLIDRGGSPRTNLFSLQYFANYNFGKGWAVGTSPTISANWDATSNDRWTVPLGASFSRTVVFNRQPMTLGIQYYHNLKGPNAAPSTTLRFTVTLIFPTKRPGS
ncbi:MAG TPA: neuromedin U [Terriglobales bacterium]